MPTPLLKHPLESRVYTLDFSGGSNPGANRRGTVWSSLVMVAGDAFSTGLTLPLLLSMVAPVRTPTVTVTRDDGVTSDLALGAPIVVGFGVQVSISGGTEGHVYTITAFEQSQAGNVVAVQGQLIVTSNLS